MISLEQSTTEWPPPAAATPAPAWRLPTPPTWRSPAPGWRREDWRPVLFVIGAYIFGANQAPPLPAIGKLVKADRKSRPNKIQASIVGTLVSFL